MSLPLLKNELTMTTPEHSPGLHVPGLDLEERTTDEGLKISIYRDLNNLIMSIRVERPSNGKAALFEFERNENLMLTGFQVTRLS